MVDITLNLLDCWGTRCKRIGQIILKCIWQQMPGTFRSLCINLCDKVKKKGKSVRSVHPANFKHCFSCTQGGWGPSCPSQVDWPSKEKFFGVILHLSLYSVCVCVCRRGVGGLLGPKSLILTTIPVGRVHKSLIALVTAHVTRVWVHAHTHTHGHARAHTRARIHTHRGLRITAIQMRRCRCGGVSAEE